MGTSIEDKMKKLTRNLEVKVVSRDNMSESLENLSNQLTISIAQVVKSIADLYW